MRPRLQGLSPREGPYHRSPYSGGRWPVLPGLCSPPRPFDRCRNRSCVTGGRRPLSGCCVQIEHNPCASTSAPRRAAHEAQIRRAPLRSVLGSTTPTVEPSKTRPAPWAVRRAASEDAAGDPCVPTPCCHGWNGRWSGSCLLTALPRAVPAPERTDLRTVASARPPRENESHAMPDDEPVGIPPPVHSDRPDQLPGSADRPPWATREDRCGRVYSERKLCCILSFHRVRVPLDRRRLRFPARGEGAVSRPSWGS